MCMTCIVYAHTNILNGKSYVGWTSKTIDWRWKKHLSSVIHGSTFHFHTAIRIHGMLCWEHKTLQICENPKEAKLAEALWIERLDTYVNGYNETKGGDGHSGFIVSEETRRKISASRKRLFETNPELRESIRNAARRENLSPETLELRSQSLKGKKSSEESRKKNSESHKRENLSAERRRRISEAAKKRCERQRQEKQEEDK